ncbi:MAG: hypothetical protein ACKO58_10595 [Cyanobium sp.]
MLDQTCKAYREIGRRLADYIIANPGLSSDPAVLAALASDFAASSLDQVAPLKDLMSRPGFQKLIPLVRTKSGVLQRDVLTDELRPIYSESVIRGITELLNEFLDLHDIAIVEASKKLYPGYNHSPRVSLPVWSSDYSTHSSALSGYLVKAGLSLAGIGLIAALIQSPLSCSFTGICSNKTLSDSQPRNEPLAQAQKSARDVRAAKGRDELMTALSQLDADLRRVDPNMLSQEQLSRLGELRKLAADSRIPADLDSTGRKDYQPTAPLKQKDVTVPQPGPIDAVTPISTAALEPAPQATKAPSVEQLQPQPERPKQVIQQQPAPPLRQAPKPTTPAPAPENPPIMRGETQGQKRYSLPPSWEERRARRRAIMNHYSGEAGQ